MIVRNRRPGRCRQAPFPDVPLVPGRPARPINPLRPHGRGAGCSTYPPLMARVCVVYSGRVQGVGFRAAAASIAHRFEVTGWVRNEDDGTVRLEAQGAPSEIEAFRGALRARMSKNILSEVASAVGEILDEPGFEVRRDPSPGVPLR